MQAPRREVRRGSVQGAGRSDRVPPGRHRGQRARQESLPGLLHKADLRAPVSLRAPASSSGKPVRPARALPPSSARALSAPGDTRRAPAFCAVAPQPSRSSHRTPKHSSPLADETSFAFASVLGAAPCPRPKPSAAAPVSAEEKPGVGGRRRRVLGYPCASMACVHSWPCLLWPKPLDGPWGLGSTCAGGRPPAALPSCARWCRRTGPWQLSGWPGGD